MILLHKIYSQCSKVNNIFLNNTINLAIQITMNNPLITLGIPTYMRRDTVLKRAKELKKLSIPEEIELLIIDNASTDGTFEALQKECVNSRIKVIQNSSNLGFHGNFVQLFKKSNGKYLLYSSDEDTIVLESLVSALDFIKKNDITFLLTQYYHNKNLYRGREKIQQMNPSDVWLSTHLPGLIFKRDLGEEFFEDFEKLQNKFSTITTYYPHIELIIHLILNGNGFWFNKAVTKQEDFLQHTHNKDLDGSEYYHLNARWRQWKEYYNFMNYYSRRYKLNIKQMEQLQDITATLQLRLYGTIKFAIRKEIPEAAIYLDKGAKRNIKNLLLKKTKRYLKKIIPINK